MKFQRSKRIVIACSRAAGILALTLAAIFAWKTQAVFGQELPQPTAIYSGSSGVPPLLAAPPGYAAPNAPPAPVGSVPITRNSNPSNSTSAASIAPANALASPRPGQPVASPVASAATLAPQPIPPAADPASDMGNGIGANVYKIGVDDVLNISVWQEPDLSRTVPVRPDGKISLPLVGDIMAAGKSAMQLQGELKLQLAKFVKNPELTVILVEMRSRRINVVGQVARPGTFPITQSMGVLDALAAAGGLRDFAKKKDIYVLRVSADGKRQRIAYNYEDVLKGKTSSQEVVLQPRDTVVVP